MRQFQQQSKVLAVFRTNVQSYTEHALQQNNDATGQKRPRCHMTDRKQNTGAPVGEGRLGGGNVRQ